MLAASHPQGRAAAPGCRLTYLLESECAGLLGGLSFVAAPMRLGPCDAAIGWGARARAALIAEVVSNDRFLLLSGVRVPHLASHALGQASRRLAEDWQKEHAVRPLLLETCVGGGRSGTSYRAAGWQCAGETRGRPPGGGPPTDAKSVWLLPLAEDWQERLAAEPARQGQGLAGSAPALSPALHADLLVLAPPSRALVRTDQRAGGPARVLPERGESDPSHPRVPAGIQPALDTLRVGGNGPVHPQ